MRITTYSVWGNEDMRMLVVTRLDNGSVRVQITERDDNPRVDEHKVMAEITVTDWRWENVKNILAPAKPAAG